MPRRSSHFSSTGMSDARGTVSSTRRTDEEEDELNAGVKKLLNDALKRAEESPLPEPSELLEGVYATPEDLDTPPHK